MNANMAVLDDNALIMRAANREAGCYAVLMHRHAPAVRQFIRSKLRDYSADIDDLVQETFLKAWLGLPGFRFEAKFRSWLCHVALNEVSALYRRQLSRPACYRSPNLDSLVSIVEPADQTASRAETTRKVRAAVSKLPPKYRETLTLCDLEELSERETAELTGLTIPAVKARRFRARKMLSASLVEPAA